jgi:SAM-dependent methyltransferase
LSDYRELVKKYIFDEETFVRATFSGQQRGQDVPWKSVSIRPVLLKGERHLQFSYLDGKKDITKNYAQQAEAKLDELLALSFRNIHLRTTLQDLQVQFTKKGRAMVHRHQAAEPRPTPSLAHDRHKDLPLPADQPDPFLQAIGIMTQQGRIKASMRHKFRQINQFLKLVTESAEFSGGQRSPLHILDCGCGSAHLTLAIYHYLNHVLGRPAQVVGIDVNRDLLRKRAAETEALGWEGLAFQVARIIDYQPAAVPDMVLALHACDTATDEALAQAVRWEAKTIYSVPCCHHHLQQQMDSQAGPRAFAPLLRHGILKERLGDILTDALRAQTLRIMGYRTDVIEFVSSEHTDRNLMIRAIRATEPGNPQAVQEYADLKALWQLEPYLEHLLAREFPASV